MNIEKAVLDGLKRYMSIEATSFAKILTEFPESNKELKMPCLSLMTFGTPEHVNLMPTIHKQTVNALDADLLDVQFAVAQKNINIQADIWASYKEERGILFDELKAALNKAFIAFPDKHATGLSLELTEYYNVIARYDMVGYTYIEGGFESQSSEFRVKVDLVCNLREIIEKTMPKLKTAKVVQGTGVTQAEADDTEETTVY